MVGLGFRKDFAEEFLEKNFPTPDFIELAPENWIGMGGYWKNILTRAARRHKIFTHGLSLSIGSPDPLNIPYIRKIKKFLDDYNVVIYSEHLSYSQCENAHLYDLLPIPFTEDAIHHIVPRIKTVQDVLERPLVLENVSYYTPVAAEMPEHEFISAIIRESGCKLLLDVNNVYVNAFNHSYNPYQFILKLPLDKVAYIHIAGHEKVSEDLIIDTHGQDVIPPVYELLDFTFQHINPVPVLLERDFNIPEMQDLQNEMDIIRRIYVKHFSASEVC